jgi:ABC-type dipeptide/oligopeptide/nickel transport system permease subunit
MNGDANLPTQTDAQLVEPPAPAPSSPAEKQERLAAWLQFPRRVVFLLIAFGVALAFVVSLQASLRAALAPTLPPECYRRGPGTEWSVSWSIGRCNQLVTEVIGQRLPNTLLLLGVGLFLALLLALIATLVAVLAHRLEERIGPLGSILRGVGRLLAFCLATPPVLVMAPLLIFFFSFQLKLLPSAGMSTPGVGGPGDVMNRLILPALTLALFPSVLTAQAVAREVTLPRERVGGRLWLIGLFKGLGVLVGQVGGVLSATVLVEIIFRWPGIGGWVLQSVANRDYPLLFGLLSVYIGLVLVGRLIAELFRWLERLVRVPVLPLQPARTRWRRIAHRLWLVLTLVLLLVPLALTVAGLLVRPEAAIKQDVMSSNKPPSSVHPLGTDDLGRDLQARVLRGGLVTLGVAALVAVIVLLPGVLGGALTGLLASRRVWWAESVADLLLLPADVLLYFPPVLGAVAIWIVTHSPAPWVKVMLVALIMLLPRAVRVYQTLWVAAPEQRKGLALGLAGSGVLFLSTLFAAFGLVTILDYLGLGMVNPPQPTLGYVLSFATIGMRTRPEGLFASGGAIWICAFAFYAAADALVGFFHKEALARLNE